MYREMLASDYQQVIQLWQDTDQMRLREADSFDNIAAYLARNPGLSFVACDGEQIVGAVLVGTDGRRGYLQHLAVAESKRGNGIGQALVQKATAALLAQGIAKTHLFVSDDNYSAQRFYGKQGWFERDEVKMYSFNASDCDNV